MNDNNNASIALSNMGISMMENSCYGQAFDTFSAAILMHSPQGTKEQEDALQQAQQRIADPLPSTAVPLRVLSHECITPIDTERVYSVVRFDTAEDASFDQHLPSCIILYNLAVSFLCCRHSSGKNSGFAIAIQLLRRSLKSLEYLYHHTPKMQNPFLTHQIVLLTSHVLQTMVGTLYQAGQRSEAVALHQTLSLICNEAQELEKTGLFNVTSKTAAPTA
jgi:hypothetical protein